MSVGVNGEVLPTSGAALGEAYGPPSLMINRCPDAGWDTAALSSSRGSIGSIRWPHPRRGTESGRGGRLCFNALSPRRVKGIIDPATCASICVFYYEISDLQF